MALDIPVGTVVLGKYRVLKPVGGGGMAEVFLAQQESIPGLERLAVLKTLKSELAADADIAALFLDEARIAAQLSHPNVVALYDVGTWRNAPWIAMEHIHGCDVSELIVAAAAAGGAVPPLVAAGILLGAAQGLHFAHTATDRRGAPLRIVHRDVSPQNLMLRADGLAKVVDFGVAQAANKVSRTRTGTIKGRLSYMAPERITGEAVDARCDQFSLGVVAWEMCAAARLFHADGELETVKRVVAAPIPPLTSLRPGFPAALDAIVRRLLQRNPAERYPSCGAVAEALHAFISGVTSAPLAPMVASYMEQVCGNLLRARSESAAAPVPEVVAEDWVEPTAMLEAVPDNMDDRTLPADEARALVAQLRRAVAQAPNSDPAVQDERTLGMMDAAPVRDAIARDENAAAFEEHTTQAASTGAAARHAESAPRVGVHAGRNARALDGPPAEVTNPGKRR